MLPNTSHWQEHETLFYLQQHQVAPSSKIAAFDIDWTIIRTKSGNIFPKDNVSDWALWCPEVHTKLNQLVQNDYRIVWFTNQEGLAKGRITRDEFTLKMHHILECLGLLEHVTILVSTKKDNYRKPNARARNIMLFCKQYVVLTSLFVSIRIVNNNTFF